jgi:branched-chain amino acid transport system substrate-binding protein
VSQAAEHHNVFHWETTGAAEIITRRGFKYTFQVGAPARKYGQAAVDVVLDDLGKRLNKPTSELKIALLWENRAFGKSVGDGIRAYSQTKGIKLVYDEGYDQTATDMTPIVQKLKDVAPDILIAISLPMTRSCFSARPRSLISTSRHSSASAPDILHRICGIRSAIPSTASLSRTFRPR